MCSVPALCFVTSSEKRSEKFRRAGWLEGSGAVEADGTWTQDFLSRSLVHVQLF